MPKNITIDGVVYPYPTSGERGWGSVATATMVAVANKLEEISADGDIPITEAALVNNQSSWTNIPGLVLDGSTVRSAVINASVYRATVSSALVADIELRAYRDSSGSGSWTLSQEDSGNSGVIFSILDTGQVQYQSSNLVGQVGQITFQYRGTITPQ